MRFAIIGTGGVGGFFGGKLAKAGEDVWFVARGEHLETMKARGLRIHSTEGGFSIAPGSMTDDLNKIGRVEVVLFCVKSYDTESAAQQLTPLLSDNTIIISLQNGIDNEEKIQRHVKTGTVFGGLANIYSTITAPGVVTETGGPKKIIFGPLTPSSPGDERGKRILGVMLNTGINASYSDDIRSDMWKKFIFISAVGGITALTRLTLGDILAADETRSLLRDAMTETSTVAFARGAKVEPQFINTLFEMIKTFDKNSRSSLYHDLAHGKPLEIGALSGTVVRHGVELGIPTPIHRTIYASLLPYHLKHIALRTSSPAPPVKQHQTERTR